MLFKKKIKHFPLGSLCSQSKEHLLWELQHGQHYLLTTEQNNEWKIMQTVIAAHPFSTKESICSYRPLCIC